MPITTTDLKNLGYAGAAEVAGVRCLFSAGGFNKEVALSYLDAYDIPASSPGPSGSRSRVKHADGVATYGGSISLDVTDDFLTILNVNQLLSRRYPFTVKIHDGENAKEMANCYVTSLTLAGTTGSLLTAEISFASAAEAVVSLFSPTFLRDQTIYGYWYSGNTNVKDWNLVMNQDVQPVYSNEDSISPRYMKTGLIDFNLTVTTYEQLYAHYIINIVTKTFTLKGTTQSSGYTFNGVSDLGTYSHSFATAGDAMVGSSDPIIS